jgi:ferredoxin
MKILVDHDLCEGNALCVKAAPEVFRVDDDDYVELIDADPGPELLDKVKEAIRRCPRNALALADDAATA